MIAELQAPPLDALERSHIAAEKRAGANPVSVRLKAVREQGHVPKHGNSRSFDQVHLVEGRQEVVIHRVVPDNDGVTVTLTNLSADRRAQIARPQVNALQASLRRSTQ